MTRHAAADQIVIADDGSDFDPLRSCRAAARTDTTVPRTLVRNNPSAFLTPPRVWAMTTARWMSSASYVGYVCDDDVLAPGWLEAAAYPTAEACGTRGGRILGPALMLTHAAPGPDDNASTIACAAPGRRRRWTGPGVGRLSSDSTCASCQRAAVSGMVSPAGDEHFTTWPTTPWAARAPPRSWAGSWRRSCVAWRARAAPGSGTGAVRA
jgi:hypothetical protein